MKRIAYDYSCLMAEIPDDVAQEIIAFADTIPDEHIYEPDNDEKGRTKHAHITVKFGIHTTDLADVEKVVAGSPLLRAKLGRVTAFNNEDFVVLKVSVQSEDLTKLNGKIKRELECTDTFPDYKPHVTIAYLKKDEKNPYYYKDFCTDDFLDREIMIGNLTFSTPKGTKDRIMLGGEVGKVAREIRIAGNLTRRQLCHTM
jgi:2'-5' RNA ligase